MKLTLDIYDWIDTELNKDSDIAIYNDVEIADVLYSYLHFEQNGFNWDKFHVRYDWNEGKNNDPYWNEEHYMHSAEYLILRLCKELKEKFNY